MIIPSLLLLFSVATISLIAIIISLFLYRKVPPKEMRLIVLCLIFEFVAFCSYSINYFYSSPDFIHKPSLVFTGLGYFLSISSMMLITYAIMLIDFKYTYKDIVQIILFTFIGGVDSIYNAVVFDTRLDGGTVEVVYEPLGILFIFCFFTLLLTIWIRRFRQISKIYRKQENYGNLLKGLFYFIVAGGIFIFIYILSIIAFDYTGDVTFVMAGAFTIIGTIGLLKNNAFPFITDIHLESIIIIEKKSGIRLFSKSFDKIYSGISDDSDFIGSVISAINVSFSDTIRSKKDLTEMNFSDKTVLIYSGAVVRSILIVSSTNLIGKGISEYLVKRFEKTYGEEVKKKISDGNTLGRQKDYSDFDETVNYVRQFLPL